MIRTKGIFAALALTLAVMVTACQHPHHNNATLVCVRSNESDTAGGYSAQNPRSSASGAYQFINRTWRAVTADMGRAGEYSRAVHAPPAYQDMVAYHALVSPGKYRSHWTGANRRC